MRVEVFNSSGVALLFDEANLEAIREANPFILEGFRGEEDVADPLLRELTARGLLLVYELYQDDEIRVDVVVGDAELPDGCQGEKRGRLELPTGRLHVASHDSLGGGDPDGVVEVPPGSYVASVRWTEEAGEVIALLPAAEVAASAILTHPSRDEYWKDALAKR